MNLEEFELPKPTVVTPLVGGANNRVYKLEFEEQNPLVLKEYFQHPNDLRPRLQTEFSFLQYAWQSGIRNIPRPLSYSTKLNSAIYSFIPGRAVTEVSDCRVKEIIDFFQALNRHQLEGKHLPHASEACFCIDDYFQITERRLDKLKQAASLSSFVQELSQEWDAIKQRRPLALDFQDRCISPSDFGFHNALIDGSNNLFFIDFEYAGWDDPCKTVCDLFCQPKIPIPVRYLPLVAGAFSLMTPNPERSLERIKLLMPVIQMKWCCILLNSFTRVGKERRTFSHSDEILQTQLAKAKQYLSKIQEFSWPT